MMASPSPIADNPAPPEGPGWRAVPLRQVISFERPDPYIVATTDYQPLGAIPVLTANKSFVLGYTDETDGICRNLPVIIFDDFTTDSKYVTLPFKVKSSAIKILHSRTDDTNLKFIAEWMTLNPIQVGEHRRHYISDYQHRSIPLPDTGEQHAIARALEDADRLMTSLEQLIAKKRDIKQAMMQQLLTGATRLPTFSKKWRDVTLGDHVKFLRTGSNSRAELRPEGPVHYIHYGDIHTSDRVYLDASSKGLPRLDAEQARNLDRLQTGDLVLVDASEDLGGVGKSVEIIEIAAHGSVGGLHTIAARFDKTILADGFKAYLQFCPDFRRQLRRLAAGTKVLATNRDHLRSVEMRLPELAEQTAIALVLSETDREITLLEQFLTKTSDVKVGMMQQLLTGRVRLAGALGGTA